MLATQGVTPNEDLLDDLLAPTRIYVQSVRQLLRQVRVNAMVHITGGGFYENVPRVLVHPQQAALIDLDCWQWPEVFAWLQQAGNITEQEMLTTFNCGLGFLLVVPAEQAEAALEDLANSGEQPVVVGEIVTAEHQPNDHQILLRANA